MSATVIHGECIETMLAMEPDSVDAIVTDPPYGLGFMGRKWDELPPGREWAEACLRVLKPGGHLLAFGGTRTFHRLTCAIEDAGFEIRDCLSWLYGSGFPKSLDVSKAIDKAAGAERVVERVATRNGNAERRGEGEQGATYGDTWGGFTTASAPATPEAAAWAGWGTALKPAWEPIVLARKPLGGTVAANVLAHGTGALNVDGCRVGTNDNLDGGAYSDGVRPADLPGADRSDTAAGMFAPGSGRLPGRYVQPAGRWPANVVLDEEAAARLDEQSGDRPSGARKRGTHKGFDESHVYGDGAAVELKELQASSGGASRFFYCAKASKRERGDGNDHPTVKPLALMRWLVRMVTPPNGVVLDPFVGSGTTLVAASLEGFTSIGIERETDYLTIIESRLASLEDEADDAPPTLFDVAA